MCVDKSASRICNRERDHYDCFALPLSTDAYVPNQRVRALLELHNEFDITSDDVRDLASHLATTLQSIHTWKDMEGGSETHINDPNSVAVLNLISSRASQQTSVGGTVPKFDFILANKKSKPEHSLRHGEFFILCTESKGRDASTFAPLVQGFEIGADAAAFMWRKGVASADVVVPVMLSFGDCLQFYAVYLIPECYPVVVCLSSALSCVTLSGRLEIARWIISLADFADNTIQILQQQQRATRRRNLGLYINPFFFKPLRNMHKNKNETHEKAGGFYRSSLEDFLSIYQIIDTVEAPERHILFPVGVLAYPQRDSIAYAQKIREILGQCFSKYFNQSLELIEQSGAIVVPFPLLCEKDGWSNNKPPESHAQAYINELCTAVSVLNDAEVAHMDLRPSNIMWRLDPDDDSKVQMQIIDLEDAERFGHPIRLWEVLKDDARYPVPSDADSPMKASAYHNDWFLNSVSAWARDTHAERYSRFMNEHCMDFF
jgi:hypothetical protein